MQTTVIDVRKVAGEILERAQDLLVTEGDFAPVGILLTLSGDLEFVGLDWRSRDARRNSKQALWTAARKTKAVAVYELSNRIFREFDKEEDHEVDVYKAGFKSIDWAGDPKVRSCICMDIYVPGEVTATVLVPYIRESNGLLKFDEPMEGTQDQDVTLRNFVPKEPALLN